MYSLSLNKMTKLDEMCVPVCFGVMRKERDLKKEA